MVKSMAEGKTIMTDKLEYESLETIVREPNLSDAKAVIGLLKFLT